MEISSLYQIFVKCNKVITDSRKAEKYSLFFALKGENFDGNEYAKSALEKGSEYVVIDNPEYATDSRCLLVKNVLETLQLLANYHRIKLNIPIIAITGTNGKTTTKELLAGVLSEKYNVSYTKGNLNNHIGVPLTLLEMNSNTQLGIVEMGANHLGEIKKLCEIASPDYGIITNIGKAHLEGFGSFENIITAKSELYNFIKKKKGKVFYNLNNPILEKIVKKLDLDSVSFGALNSSVFGEIMPTDKFLSLEINIGEVKGIIKTNLIGNYNFENILAAASVGHFFEVNAENILSAIENYIPTNNRSQFIKTNYNNLFVDAYNANPTSVEASVKNFTSIEVKNKCIILGDMLELGNESLKEHEKIVAMLAKHSFYKVILVGEIYNSIHVNKEYFQFHNVNNLIEWLSIHKFTDSNILIKGSRGIKLESIINYL